MRITPIESLNYDPARLPPIDKYTDGDTYVRCVMALIIKFNQQIQELNYRIHSYNKRIDSSAKNAPKKCIERLTQIYSCQRAIESSWSSNVTNIFPGFARYVQKQLFEELKRAFAELGVNRLYTITNPTPPTLGVDLADILSNMAPDTLDLFIDILSATNFSKDRLIGLYSPRNSEFDAFLANNTMALLGSGNTQVFEVTPAGGAAPYILKVENRLGAHSLATERLKVRLPATIGSELAIRHGCAQEGRNPARRVSITPLYSEGTAFS